MNELIKIQNELSSYDQEIAKLKEEIGKIEMNKNERQNKTIYYEEQKI